MSYAAIWASLARRAVAEGALDIETFLDRMVNSGASEDTVNELLENDLATDGPIFGKFSRSLSGAASASVGSASRQGELVSAVADDDDLMAMLKSAGVESELDRALAADPDAADAIEDAVADDMAQTWVAELNKTCHRCLPLHGRTMTARQWREAGLHPDIIHSGWASDCHCRLVDTDLAEDRGDLMGPLVRVKLPKDEQPEGFKSTRRAVSQLDIERGLAARNKAMETPEGRRTLRILGQAGGG